MKKIILLMVFFLSGVNAHAYTQPLQRVIFNSPGIQHLIIHYGDDLQLTDDQKKELIALQVKYRDQFKNERRMVRRGARNFKSDRFTGSRQESRARTSEKSEKRAAGDESRMDIRKEILNILTDDQQQVLEASMLERAESAHELRTLRYTFMVNETGIEGDKADQVLDLLNKQSEARLELAKQRVMNPEEANRDFIPERFRQMRNTDEKLQSILTVNEYESLRGKSKLRFGNHPQRRSGREYRLWNR